MFLRCVALWSIPDSKAWRMTSFISNVAIVRLKLLRRMLKSMAGLISRPTGGSCAESPISSNLQQLPLKTYSIRSSKRDRDQENPSP